MNSIVNTENIKRVMSCFDSTAQLCNDQCMYFLRKNIEGQFIDLEMLKIELLQAIEDEKFPWIDLALETNFIYTSSYFNPPQHEFTRAELIDYVNNRGFDYLLPDETPTNKDIKVLNHILQKIAISDTDTIQSIFNKTEFDWMKFGTKQRLFQRFGKDVPENRDVIYTIKSYIWNFLFPNSLDNFDKIEDTKLAFEMLKKNEKNDGWLDCDEIVTELSNKYPNDKIDFFYVSQLNWDNSIQHKHHERTQFSLGYKRIKPSKKLISQLPQT